MCSTSSCGVGAVPSKTITEATCMCAVELSSRCKNVESSAVKRSGLATLPIVAVCQAAVNEGTRQRCELVEHRSTAQGKRAHSRDETHGEPDEWAWRANHACQPQEAAT